jgi:hypothetical protein
VERDPVATLKAHGIHVDPAKLPVDGVTLPSKEAVRQSLDKHVTAFDAPMGIVIFKA